MSLKKFTVLSMAIIVSLFLFATCGGSKSKSGGAGNELDRFIREVSNYLNKQVPQGNRVAVMSAAQTFPNLSEYVIDGIMENAVNDRVFTVVDRAQLDAIRSELEFQTSGEVSDETVQSMGRMLGANTVVTVVSSKMGNQYRFRIRALSVESAEILGMMNRNVAGNSTIDALVGTSAATAVATATSQRTQATSPSSTNRTSNQTTSTNRTTTPSTRYSDDGGEFGVVNISGKRWMNRNLNLETDDSWCYRDDPANCVTYGRLYTWQAALMACDNLGNGWRLPTVRDWENLVSATGGGSAAGQTLQSRSANGNGTDRFGFSALLGGYRSPGRSLFSDVGEGGYWWTATESPNQREIAARPWVMFHNRNWTRAQTSAKGYGYSVRCVRD